MRCDCSYGFDCCNCCGRDGEPIPTDFGDIEEERSRVGGLVTVLMAAVSAVGFALVFVALFGPK